MYARPFATRFYDSLSFPIWRFVPQLFQPFKFYNRLIQSSASYLSLPTTAVSITVYYDTSDHLIASKLSAGNCQANVIYISTAQIAHYQN